MIYTKLHKAKLSIGKVVKNAKNPHFKKNYADINALIETVEPILLENGLLLLQPVINGKVCTQIIDIETGEKLESIIELDTKLNAQQLGSQITYYRRYTLQSLLSLQAEDDDGTKASQPNPVKQTIAQEKKTLTEDRFKKALESIKNGVITKEKVKETFELSIEQLKSIENV
jgi:hypothetical protein